MKNYINTPKINVPFTTIVNRTQIPDLSKGLSVRMGVERIPTQNIFRLSDEQGPNGENVYGVEGDDLGLVRFVGNWENETTIANGACVRTSTNITDYMEITFYGTSLNMTMLLSGALIGMVASIDNGAESAELLSAYSTVLEGRNYRTNQIINVASAISLGLHTVRIRTNNAGNFLRISGYEVLNESTQLTINQGEGRLNDAVITTLAQSNLAYNSGFESGTLGTKGGRVAVYQKIDGTIGHAVTPVDATQKNLALADHSNEEVSRVYNFREFGAGRADDFSTLAGAVSNRAFTLDDGSTTLVGNQILLNVAPSTDSIRFGVTGSFITITFIGTGLDIARLDDSGGTNDTYEVFVDGATIGNAQPLSSLSVRKEKIVSGLEYGTHTVKILRQTNNSYRMQISDFIVYQPKTPSIPVNANLLGTYNILADFVANTVQSLNTISTGVIRKQNMREFVYSGTFIVGLIDVISFISGVDLNSQSSNSHFKYTFYGTGFDFRFLGNASQATGIIVDIDGNVNHSTLTTSTVGVGVTFNNITGSLNQNTAPSLQGCGLLINGLALGLHTVTFTQPIVAAVGFRAGVLDIITPIYSPVQNTRNKQSTLAIGNNSIADHRKFTELENVVKKVNYSRVVGASLPGSITTTSTAPVPLPEFITQLKTNGNAVEVNFTGSFYISAINVDIVSELYIDGKLASIARTQPTGPDPSIHSISDVFKLDKGVHTFQMFWWVNGATTGIFWYPSEAVLTVKEL